MKKTVMGLCGLALFAASALPILAESNPWDGAWKVEPSSFHFEGMTYTWTTDSKGFKVMMGGQTVAAEVCDGKPETKPSGMESTCVKSPGGYTVTDKRDGKVGAVIKLKVSANGRKLERVAYITAPGEAPYTITMQYEHAAGSKGLAGDWKETGFSETRDTGVLHIMVDGDSVAFQETDSPKPVTCKLDGTPTEDGRGFMSVTQIDPHTLKVKYMDPDKKVVRENTFALSLDGKTISETDFTADPTPSAMTLLLHKM